MSEARTIVPADDSFHAPATDDPYWLETCWFSFWVPERKVSGTIYPWFRPNVGVCAAGVAIWDDTAELPWEVLHFDYSWQMPMPKTDLTDILLDNGLSIVRLEPLRRYQVRYASGDAVELDLTFDAVMEPHDVPLARLRFVGAAHFDQVGRVTGRLRLGAEEIAVDCYGMRDRSWGPRPDRGTVYSGYASGMGPHGGFHAITSGREDDQPIMAGYLVRDGQLADVSRGQRRVLKRDKGRPLHVLVEGEDDLGRPFRVEGRCVNRLAFHARPNVMTWMSLTHWDLDGQQIWGEDQDIWSLDLWRDFARAL